VIARNFFDPGRDGPAAIPPRSAPGLLPDVKLRAGNRESPGSVIGNDANSRMATRLLPGYAVAIGAPPVALGLTSLVLARPDVRLTPMGFFYLGVVAAAWFGPGPGLVAALVSFALSAYFVYPPAGSFTILPHALPALVLFGLVSAVISVMTAGLHRARPSIAVIEDIDERKRSTARMEAVSRITEAMLRQASLDDVLHELLDRMRKSMSVDEATVLLLDAEGHSLTVRASRGMPETPARQVRIPIGRGVAGRVAAHDEAVVISDLKEVEVFRPELRETVQSLMAVPLKADSRVIGVLHVGTAIRREFTSEDRAFLELVAERVAAIIERARLHESERTARVEAEASRAAAESTSEQLRLALEAGRMGTWQFDLRSQSVEWSAGLEAIHGYAPGTFPGTFEAFRKEIHPEDRAAVLGAIQAAISQRQEHHIEYRIVRADGTVRWVEGRGRLFLDDRGEPERMVGVCLDITERKHAEERFRLAVEAAPTAEIMVDARGVIVLANALSEQLFGYPRAELVGMSIERLVPLRFRDRHPHHRSDYFSQPQPRPMGAGRDLYALRKNGTEVPVEIGLSPIGTEDGDFVLAAVTDITERIRLHDAERAARADAEAARREAEAANRGKANFLAAMSHDLRTPLNAIGGYAQLLELEVHGALTPAQRDALARIQQNQKRVLTLLNELLTFSRIEAQRVEYDITTIALDQVLSSLEAIVGPQLAQKQLVYDYRPCDEALTVRGDRDKVEQTLVNLLTNAIKFTDAGGRISVEVEAAEGRVGIHVRDTGRGISADRLATVFEPFVQVDSSARLGEGFGLGLAISSEFARGMGGEITVRSTPGAGSTFTLWLPA
jgi:protein-histidine pros-kinase